MIFLVREIPLGPQGPEYEVRYAPEVVSETAARDDAEELMDELEEVLSVTLFRPPGNRSTKLEGTGNLRRYRPHADNDTRVFYAVEGDEDWILSLHPRKKAYRRQNIETALARFHRAQD